MPATHAQSSRSHLLGFDCYEVDLFSGELRKRGIRLPLREQSFKVLAALLEYPGEIVSREQLHELLWHGTVFVDFDNNLNTVVAHLREVLCDSADHPRFIETLPKHGYRFIGEVYGGARPGIQSEPRRNRVLVLPFVNLSADPVQDYFSNAMTDDMITALAQLAPERLAVLSRTTAMHYKNTRKDVARIGRELNAEYVVEGGVRCTDQRIAINLQIIQTSDQSHVFARRYESGVADIFHLQRSMAQDIAAHLAIPGIAEEAQRISASAQRTPQPTDDILAYNEYIQGRYLAERLIPEDMIKARQHFEEALRRDAGFALAHMALADLYSWFGYKGYYCPIDAYERGKPHALRAVELDPTLAEAHAVLASYHKQLDYDWTAAKREMAKALELNRNSPIVRYLNALVILMPHNRMGEAVAELRGALEADPLDIGIRCWLGIMLLLARDYAAGIEEARYMRELEPNSCWPPFIEGIAYRQKYFEASLRGNIRLDWAEIAVAQHRRAVELAPGADHVAGWLGFALGVCGRKDEARALLEQFLHAKHYVLPTSLAHLYLGLGEIDLAFEWFDRAVEERDQNMMAILSYAHFDPLRSDPRFAQLLRKMKLDSFQQQSPKSNDSNATG